MVRRREGWNHNGCLASVFLTLHLFVGIRIEKMGLEPYTQLTSSIVASNHGRKVVTLVIRTE